MQQALDALLKLHKSPVLLQTHNTALDPLALVIPLLNVLPGVRRLLLVTQRNLVMLPVEAKDYHLHLIPNLEILRGMLRPTPGNVGAVKQTVYSAKVYENPPIRYVLHYPLDCPTFLKLRQSQLDAVLQVRLENCPTREDDVPVRALHLEVEYLHRECLPNELIHVPNRMQVQLGPRQKGLDALEVHRVSPSLAADDRSLYWFIVLELHLELVPEPQPVSASLRQHDKAVLVLDCLEDYFYLLTYLCGDRKQSIL